MFLAIVIGLIVGFLVFILLLNAERKPHDITTSQGNILTIKPILTTQKFVRHNAFNNFVESGRYRIKNFTVIDFETANMYPDSICQVGIAVVKNGTITESRSWLIRPPYNDFRNSKIHGITLKDVENSPTFQEAWGEIKPYIEHQFVGAYNAPFDIGCLEATLENYAIQIPEYATFDILENARSGYPNLNNHRLSSVLKEANIELQSAHDAESDANATAKLQTKLTNVLKIRSNVHFKIKNKSLLHSMRESVMRPYDYWQEALELERKEKLSKKPQKDFAPVFALYEKGLAAGDPPTDGLMLRNYGELLEELGHTEKALEMYQAALALNPKAGLKLKVNRMLKKI